MPDREVTATTTFREFIDARRNSDGFNDRVQEVVSGQFKPKADQPAMRLESLGHVAEGDVWRLGSDVFIIESDERGNEEGVAKFALWRRKVLRAGGEATDSFERPTKDGWE